MYIIFFNFSTIKKLILTILSPLTFLATFGNQTPICTRSLDLETITVHMM